MKFIFIFVVEGLTFPEDWDPPDECDPYRRKQLPASSSEYQEVFKNVQKTIGGLNVKIIKVCTHLVMQR